MNGNCRGRHAAVRKAVARHRVVDAVQQDDRLAVLPGSQAPQVVGNPGPPIERRPQQFRWIPTPAVHRLGDELDELLHRRRPAGLDESRLDVSVGELPFEPPQK